MVALPDSAIYKCSNFLIYCGSIPFPIYIALGCVPPVTVTDLSRVVGAYQLKYERCCGHTINLNKNSTTVKPPVFSQTAHDIYVKAQIA